MHLLATVVTKYFATHEEEADDAARLKAVALVFYLRSLLVI